MPNYSYLYIRAVTDEDGNIKTEKFLKGNPELLGLPKDIWETRGRYNLSSRQFRGGLSGSGDVYHPANITLKV
ncbi:hypothetical protein PV325_014054 [Microctonus aethiopoides]|nr:hypothetical protein PV325_014054 [Microctonus aethiopoides]